MDTAVRSRLIGSSREVLVVPNRIGVLLSRNLGAHGRLVNDTQGARAADPLLEVWERELLRWWRLRAPERGSVEDLEHSPRVPAELIGMMMPTCVNASLCSKRIPGALREVSE